MNSDELQNPEFKKSLEDLTEELSVVIRRRGDDMEVLSMALAWMLASTYLGYVGMTVEQSAANFEHILGIANRQMNKATRQ